MADATLIAERRSAAGKGPAGRVRREGLVPAVVYGLGEDNVSVSVSSRELLHILSGGRGMNTLITLKVDGGEELAIARQIQRHPVRGSIMHVDFVRVRADQTIQAEIPVHLLGDAEGAARGGILEQVVHTLTVEAKATELPEAIEHDIASLEIGGQVFVRDLSVPAGVTVLQSSDDLVAQVSAPRVAEVAEGAEGEAAEGVAPSEGAAPAAEAPSAE
ncbi:MAG TPA: 50S ribosomal protein L25/general stress protein Ctc [Acidimicrobiia bacterium]|nr:50S ribosomal protein L25/general stress protein Ctc [Acidimicrobiia bacterium]